MNFLSFGKVIVKNIFAMQALTRKLGEPVRLTKEECDAVFEDVKADKMMANKFALICDIKTMSIGVHYNTEKFLQYNIYTLLHEMEENENVPIISRFYNDGFEVKEWTQTVWKDFFTKQIFELTKEQGRIVEVLHKNMGFSNTQIAEALDKTKNTIDVQNKHIKARAKAAFPNQAFGTIRDVVRFLREIGYFQEDISEGEE